MVLHGVDTIQTGLKNFHALFRGSGAALFAVIVKLTQWEKLTLQARRQFADDIVDPNINHGLLCIVPGHICCVSCFDVWRCILQISHCIRTKIQSIWVCFCQCIIWGSKGLFFVYRTGGQSSSVRKILKRRGPGTSGNLRRTKIWIRNCSTQF